jgi:hypothetical protein
VPIHYEVRVHDRVVVVTLVGALTVQDYASAAEKVLADPMAKAGFGLLLDGGAVNPLPNLDELRALVQVARELTARGIQPFALVAANEPQYLVARLFAMLAGATINLDARVFRAKEVAYDWLKMKVATKVPDRPDELGGSRGAGDSSVTS